MGGTSSRSNRALPSCARPLRARPRSRLWARSRRARWGARGAGRHAVEDVLLAVDRQHPGRPPRRARCRCTSARRGTRGRDRRRTRPAPSASTGERRRHRQHAPGEALGDAHQVGRDLGEITRPHRAEPTIPGEHLVDDHEHVVFGAQVTHRAQIRGRVHAHARGALHDGLEHHRGDGGVLALDDLGDGVEGLAPQRCTRDVVAGGRRHVHTIEDHAGERPSEHLDAPQARGAEGLAMEGTVEREEARLLGPARLRVKLQGHLHRGLDRGGAVVGVEHLIEPARRDLGELLGEQGRGLVGDARERDVTQPTGLPLQRRDEPRVVVAEGADPPRTVAVEQPLAARELEPRALGAHHHERIVARAPLVHRRVGVPEVARSAARTASRFTRTSWPRVEDGVGDRPLARLQRLFGVLADQEDLVVVPGEAMRREIGHHQIDLLLERFFRA